MYVTHYMSPVGLLEIKCDMKGIISIHFIDEVDGAFLKNAAENPLLLDCVKQLDEYFMGTRRIFELQLQLDGTEFQKQVWNSLCNVSYGSTATYRDIALAVGSPRSARAIGNANNKNRIPIIIPCHRIIGCNGSLTGYAGGLWRKEWLLLHEKKFSR
jgi:O-6-methylguanine DNA methyltransferase